ncbi:hypothetical protein D5S17_35650 [Pseudonocardiaceae bacterium YIM PH 21723]|nr:hypothetical protein D5S17_35650 [Pseudonocardiaceae bacterium YIM PH 21723]
MNTNLHEGQEISLILSAELMAEAAVHRLVRLRMARIARMLRMVLPEASSISVDTTRRRADPADRRGHAELVSIRDAVPSDLWSNVRGPDPAAPASTGGWNTILSEVNTELSRVLDHLTPQACGWQPGYGAEMFRIELPVSVQDQQGTDPARAAMAPA